MGMGVPAVGGGLGVVGLLVVLLFNVLGGGGSGGGINIPALGPVDRGQPGGTIPANDDAAQFAAFVIHDVQSSWDQVFTDSNEQYRETKLVLYTSATSIWARCKRPLKSTYTDFHSEKTSSAAVPASRWPLPVAFVPPNGRWTSAPMVGALT